MRKWVSSPAYEAAISVLVDARKRQGLTQRELERRLGQTHHGLVAKIETRERQINLVEFVALARALKLKEVDLFREVLETLPEELDV
jgi:transcriptional regulator with XRE-family HTH domain